jgi:hypothetical protein
MELAGVLHAMPSHFVDQRIFHVFSPKKASGDTISGHSYPAFSTDCRIIILVDSILSRFVAA